MQLDYTKLHAALDAMENQAPVFAAINGEVKECTVEWFQLKPMRYVVKTDLELHNVDDILLEDPGVDFPEAGREVRHKATGLIIRSAGRLRNGNLVDDQGTAWEDDAWVDEDLERRKAEAEAKRLAEEKERRKREEADAAAKAKQEEINQQRAESEPEPEKEG